MKTLPITVAFLLAAAPAWGQSLLQGEGSPNDPPKKPSLKRHDHVVITFAEPAKAAGDAESRVRWDKDLRDWVRAGAKDAPPAAAITAEVVDIRPSGALVLEAVKRRIVNQEEEVVRLTCEVAPGNVIQNRTTSEHLSTVTLTYDGAGVDGAKPGLLGWLFGKLWPF